MLIFGHLSGQNRVVTSLDYLTGLYPFNIYLLPLRPLIGLWVLLKERQCHYPKIQKISPRMIISTPQEQRAKKKENKKKRLQLLHPHHTRQPELEKAPRKGEKSNHKLFDASTSNTVQRKAKNIQSLQHHVNRKRSFAESDDNPSGTCLICSELFLHLNRW